MKSLEQLRVEHANCRIQLPDCVVNVLLDQVDILQARLQAAENELDSLKATIVHTLGGPIVGLPTQEIREVPPYA